MANRRVLITGSCGLIGSEAALFFARQGHEVFGIDNNQRAILFGPGGDTGWMLNRLAHEIPSYRHAAIDVRNREGVQTMFREARPNLVLHAAAQPSHDHAGTMPVLDFEINALGTLNVLEAARQFCPEAPFIHMSTNKVYGDRPNALALKELNTRWDFDDARFPNGIGEDLSIDQTTHSVFGASKVAADVMVQEYGRYFDMPTCCLRGGCLTGPNHSGVESHGFLSYLVRCNVGGEEYKVFGYKGKQVRDNIHSKDVVRFIYEFGLSPRRGEVYNIGGGRENSCSILEAFELVEEITGQKTKWRYVEQNRRGDHICYYSDLRKMKQHFPAWNITRDLDAIVNEIAVGWKDRLRSSAI